MVKIIYLDIDGTLRDEQKGIPNSAILAIKQCQKRKIQIIICTGRNFGSIQNDVITLQTDGIISGGGCYILYHGEEIFRKHFSIKVLKKVLSIASDRQLSLAMETKCKIYMDQNTSRFYKDDFYCKIRNNVKSNNKINQETFHIVNKIMIENKITYKDNFEELWKEIEKVHKICIFGNQTAIEKTELDLKKETETIQKKRWKDRWYLELLPKGCNKGSAIKKLNQKLGIPKKKSMSFGDSENDIAMMEATGIAVAVGCKNSIIGNYASSICEPIMEDGIYKELLRRNIIEPFEKFEKERRTQNEETMVAGGSGLSDLSEKFL